jgi:hypothetical protein
MSFVNTYTPPLVVDPVDTTDAVAKMFAIRRAGTPIEYGIQVFHLNATGVITGSGDITPLVNASDSAASVRYDCTADVPMSINLQISSDEPIVYGSDRLHVYALLRSSNYNRINGYEQKAWLRFDLGYYIVTTPGWDDMDVTDLVSVTGYGLGYLLQKSPNDSYSFAAGANLGASVTTLLRGAGVLAVTDALATICDYPGDWSPRLLVQPMNFPLGSVDDYITAINQLLAASGQRGIYSQMNGRWMIEPIPTVTSQATRWLFAGSEDPLVSQNDLDAKTVLMHSQRYSGDVHNIPNQFIFIQDGLTFQPGFDGHTDGSSGLYVLNNLDTPPAGQSLVKAVLPDVVTLNALGQADLKTQGDAYFADQLASVETIALTTAPWPVARHYDVFNFVHAALPFSSNRRLQTQSWEYFLFGNPTTMATKAVSLA